MTPLMKKRAVQAVLGILGICLLLGGLTAHQTFLYLRTPITSHSTQSSKIIHIPKGASFHQIVQILEEHQLVDRPQYFQALAIWRGVASQIKAGEYQVQASWTPDQMLEHLVAGRSRLYRITIPEGLNYREISTRLAAAQLGTEARYLELQSDPSLLQYIDITPKPSSLEGFLFPETYFFPRSESEFNILRTMIQQFNQNYTEEHRQKAKSLGLTDYEVLTLASIIEKETGRGEDRPLISAVFHNRLKRKMRLESDPTVIYGIQNFDGNLTRKHLRTPTPYNTYTIAGLPPGPICNPGKASIESTLAPAEVKYLYFVAKGDGTSQFSTNLKSHNRAVWKYQKSRRNRVKHSKTQQAANP